MVLICLETSGLVPRVYAQEIGGFIPFSNVDGARSSLWQWIINSVNKTALVMDGFTEGKQIINAPNNNWINEPTLLINYFVKHFFIGESISDRNCQCIIREDCVSPHLWMWGPVPSATAYFFKLYNSIIDFNINAWNTFNSYGYCGAVASVFQQKNQIKVRFVHIKKQSALTKLQLYENPRSLRGNQSVLSYIGRQCGSICCFVSYKYSEYQSASLQDPNRDQEKVENKEPPIVRRLIVAIFLNLSGYSIAAWGICHFNDKRRILRASFIFGGLLLLSSGYLLIFASSFH